MTYKEYCKVYETNDYDSFSFLKGNRSINPVHVARLMGSFMKKQLTTPILVNENMEIIDGQHRFEACRKLELPIYYIIEEGYSLKECHILNVITQRYTGENFLQGYIALGKENYIRLQEFRTQFPYLSLHLCQIYLTGGIRHDRQYLFKQGEFRIENYDTAVLWASQTYDFKPYATGFFCNRNFNTALLKLFRCPNYDHERMLTRLHTKGGELRHNAREAFFIENLCAIYNHQTKLEDRIYPYLLTNQK